MSEPNSPEIGRAPKSGPDKLTKILRVVLAVVLGLVVLAGGYYAYAYAVSPVAIRHPKQVHYHLRLQIINDGQAVNFADSKFQTEFNKDICSAAITKEPIHFHDGKDQFVHVHWALVTGGVLLKDYGWNFIGGTNDILGYKMNGLRPPEPVKIHGHALPTPPKDAKYYVYTGGPSDFKERNWKDFLGQNMVEFINNEHTSFLDKIVPAVYAHGDGDGHDAGADSALVRLNNFQGDVVIFVQKDKPTADQVKERFEHVIPLPESQCAG